MSSPQENVQMSHTWKKLEQRMMEASTGLNLHPSSFLMERQVLYAQLLVINTPSIKYVVGHPVILFT